MSARDRLPPWLAAYVVDQDYDVYTETDHRVWHTVLSGIHGRLARTAHPAYARGLEAAGMSLDRIPRIDAMDARLAEIGWGAVCVDGFIPPRAFQALQAERVLPISAAIRRADHLEYTPAPDIVHEAAGHAPMLADPEYAAFVERIGALGARTFSLPADREAFEAIRHLSIVKEAPDATADEVAAAERRLEAAVRTSLEVSEAAMLARLYWWTVEYGLVGTVDDYRLYGAGLLSSLGESASCHRPEVRKIPLTPACVDVGYDITREQSQLFVAESFAQVLDVLEDVMGRTADRRGGTHALEIARRSGERAVLVFESGARLDAVVQARSPVSELASIYRLGGPLRVHLGGDGASLEVASAALLDSPEGPFLHALPDDAPATLAAFRASPLVAGPERLGRRLASARPAMPGAR